jgi:dimethylhistidine N-methyltransferase
MCKFKGDPEENQPFKQLMTTSMRQGVRVQDLAPESGELLAQVLEGLRQSPKSLPSKLFYDAEGSRLFDRITTLEEYYPTRTELAIMERYADEMVACFGTNALLVEYGSGSSLKTRLLLDRAQNLAGYIPIDISGEHLADAASKLAALYPALKIVPVNADYTEDFSLPLEELHPSRIVVYFPGSTIGNFTPGEAIPFLHRISTLCCKGGGLLIGVDLKKDKQVLEAAYNDARGITSAFNLNILRRINQELGGTFALDRFRHKAFYNEAEGRIEMHLESLSDQSVRVDGATIPFRKGETIQTEYSYKYTLAEFERLGQAAGFAVEKVWTDERQFFSVQYLTVTD